MKINKILIANRGEIAVRIIKTCKNMGIKTVTIYSDADKGSLHTKLGDESYYVGRSPPIHSYLNIQAIIDVARKAQVDAVHPGYGFMSENASFAEAVEKEGIIWIGPPPKVMRMIESKSFVRKLAMEAGVPVVPGSIEPVGLEEAENLLKKHGQILIKPDMGGGGKGMKLVRSVEELHEMFESARREASYAAGKSGVYIEKYIERPRHIEVQILADSQGNIISLGERECSIQRKYQKVIEEAPSPVVDVKTRAYISDLAKRILSKIGYVNAATVEFIRDQQGNFYLIEINKRIQVEHPVTEMVTGVDIVEKQIKIAGGEQLDIKEDLQPSGHAIEARIFAEDPETFMPSPGKITELYIPNGEGIRVDHALEKGANIPPFYDPMIAKVITYGISRDDALGKMVKALHEFKIDGIKTNIKFLLKILEDEEFKRGNIHTHFIEERILKYNEKRNERKWTSNT